MPRMHRSRNASQRRRWIQRYKFDNDIPAGRYAGVASEIDGEINMVLVPVDYLGTERDVHIIPGIADPEYEELIRPVLEAEEEDQA